MTDLKEVFIKVFTKCSYCKGKGARFNGDSYCECYDCDTTGYLEDFISLTDIQTYLQKQI